MPRLVKGRGRNIIEDDDSDPPFKLETFNKEPLTEGGTPLDQSKLGWSKSKVEKPISGNNHPVFWRLNPATQWAKCQKLNTFLHQDTPISVGCDVKICRDDKALETGFDNDPASVSYARILEIRRATPTKCWLRIFWWYWPQGLPNGRQKWHGVDELVATTEMAIIDSDSVMSLTSIVRLLPNDEAPQEVAHYWRQEYHWITGNLSSIETMCFCHQPQNPDGLISGCEFCDRWHHNDCLKEAACKYQWLTMGNQYEFSKQNQIKVSTAQNFAIADKFPWKGILEAELEYKDDEKKTLTYYAWVTKPGRTDLHPVKVPIMCTNCPRALFETKVSEDGSTTPTSKLLTIREKTHTPPPPTPTLSEDLSEVMSPKRKRIVKSRKEGKKEDTPYTPLTPRDSGYATPETGSPKQMSSEDEVSTPRPARKMSRPEIMPLSRSAALSLRSPQRRTHASLSIEPKTPERKTLLSEAEREALSPYSVGSNSNNDWVSLRAKRASMLKSGRKTM